MKISAVLFFLFAVPGLFAAPALYNLKHLPAANAPVIDGSMTEWTEGYFLDTLQSEDNVWYYSSDYGRPWTPEKFQMRLYGAYDSAKVYFAVKVTADRAYHNCGPVNAFSDSCDNIKVNPGGRAVSFYIWANGNYYPNPSVILNLGYTLWVDGDPLGNNGLPTYEVAIKRSATRFPADTFKYCIGAEDVSDYRYVYAAFGVEYTGDKSTSGNPNSWDQPLYYPAFVFSGIPGGPMAVESAPSVPAAGAGRILAPNPFRPGMAVSVVPADPGVLAVYDLKGAKIGEWPGLCWNGKDASGRALPDGVYLLAVRTPGVFVTKKIVLIR